MIFSGPSLRWFGLNIVRALSIAALILVISSSIVIMVRDANALCREIDLRVKSQSNELDRNPNIGQAYMPWSTVPLQPGGGFFAILSRLLTILQCILLILAELGWPHSFFIKFVPILGHEYGVGILGLIQALLSTLILSHRIPTFPLISAFILFAVACLNIIIGLILREKVHHYRAWSVTTPNEVCPELALPKNRRISFRPRGKRSTIFNSVGDPTCSKIEKLPIYTESYESKNQRSEVLTSKKPPLVVTSLGFGRQAQQGAEAEWCCLPIPEHSHPKL